MRSGARKLLTNYIREYGIDKLIELVSSINDETLKNIEENRVVL